MQLKLKVHDTQEEITVTAPTFPALCAALFMELNNTFGVIHSNVFDGLKQFCDNEGDMYTHTDFSVPEENFTLTLTN